MNSLTTGSATSASSSATRTSRRAASTSSSRSAPRRRMRSKMSFSLPLRYRTWASSRLRSVVCHAIWEGEAHGAPIAGHDTGQGTRRAAVGKNQNLPSGGAAARRNHAAETRRTTMQDGPARRDLRLSAFSASPRERIASAMTPDDPRPDRARRCCACCVPWRSRRDRWLSSLRCCCPRPAAGRRRLACRGARAVDGAVVDQPSRCRCPRPPCSPSSPCPPPARYDRTGPPLPMPIR